MESGVEVIIKSFRGKGDHKRLSNEISNLSLEEEGLREDCGAIQQAIDSKR